MVKYDHTYVTTNPSYSIRNAPTAVAHWATEHAWNRARYECYLCHRTYATLPTLNQHPHSTAHAEKLYRCPRALYWCGTEFGTLSAFCWRVESEWCGVRQFCAEGGSALGCSRGCRAR